MFKRPQGVVDPGVSATHIIIHIAVHFTTNAGVHRSHASLTMKKAINQPTIAVSRVFLHLTCAMPATLLTR